MDTIRVETVIETDGVLQISNLPCHKGDRVEAIIQVHERLVDDEREAARQRFLARARESLLYSDGPYPGREQLHERA
jgi:hypothetical protein